MSEEAAHVLFAATAQMGLALRESQTPVGELGSQLARLTETLATLRSSAQGLSLTDQELLVQLQADVFAGIQSMQFYDRMVQHLTHIEEFVIGVANELSSVKAEPGTSSALEELRARLRKRLISDEQRGLLDLFLTPETTTRVSAQAVRADYSPPGSFEMF